nr:MAG TPA: hypothetical protein [Caudoviricetes sp.]
MRGGKGKQMSPMERLGLAFCRLENLCWDEAAGEKPQGFDDAKDSVKRSLVQEPMRKIKAMLGEPYINRCRWVFDQLRSEQSWLEIQSRLYDKGLLHSDYGGDDFGSYTKAFLHHHFTVFFEKMQRFLR